MFDQNETLEQARARNVREALEEDIGRGDWTGQLIPEAQQVRAHVVVREQAVLCGQAWFEGCLLSLDPDARIQWYAAEGAVTSPGVSVADIDARTRALLAAERPALNFLQLLSATATSARRYVTAIAGASPNPHGCCILDTRKTMPGLRLAQKYAVRIGGATNHRLGLYDGILIKENHIAAAGGVAAALRAARALQSGVVIQIEVETLAQLQVAVASGATDILLDNFTPAQMRE
ncbi:MAG TPA: carboxylating nicotinate-nucleotide diphosphorylase, partial [Burkholderiaceae bacterium]